MGIKIILKNQLGIIETHTSKGRLVYRSKSVHCYKGEVVCDQIKTYEEARNILWEESTDQDYNPHYYKWGNEKEGYVSCWLLFSNGDWMSLGEKKSELIIGNSDWTSNCPH